MISEFFFGLATFFVDWLADMFGEWSPPPEFTQARDSVQDLLSGFSSVGVWVNWTVLAACVAVSVLSWGSVFLIKFIRAVVAHVPVFGGSGD